MPRYRVTFENGETFEGDFANGDLAKRAAKADAQRTSGATMRTDPAVKVAHVVDLDAEPGPTDPLGRASAPPARTPRTDSRSSPRSDRDRLDLTERERRERDERDDRERREREGRT
jgi:hypothetical protein